MSEYKSKEESQQFWAALRRAQRLSERIRQRMMKRKLVKSDETEEGIAVVPITDASLNPKRRLLRRTK
jgi:hypothetical protein